MQNVRVDLGSASVRMVQLKERHDELEKRLAELERHLSLTPDEQLERSRLKKEKLRTKDELTRLGAVRAPSPALGAHERRGGRTGRLARTRSGARASASIARVASSTKAPRSRTRG